MQAFAIKEAVVLMPLRTTGVDKAMLPSIEGAVVEGLSGRYKVYAGERVVEKVKAVYKKLSQETEVGKECDQTRCLQDIAIEFQTELVVTTNVVKMPSGYTLTLNIQNVLEDEVVYSKSDFCRACDFGGLLDSLKKLASGRTAMAGSFVVTGGGISEVTAPSSGSVGGSISALIIDSSPSNAYISIDGISKRKTPYQDLNMKAGTELDIVLKKELYKDKSLTVTLGSGVNDLGSVKLASNYGIIKVDSNPSGAKVEARDGTGSLKVSGTTPFNGKLAPGSYSLKISKTGYAGKEYKVDVVVGSLLSITSNQASLRELQGTLIVSSEPFVKGAEVFVDGSKVGNVPATLSLPAGRHEVKVKHGGKGGTKSLTIADGKTATVVIPLKSLAPIKDVGSFSDNGNGTITQKATGLMWQKEDDGSKYNWFKAKSYCRGLSLGGYSDWRLPAINELKKIIDEKYAPTINPIFKNTKSSIYWSATTNASNTSYAWNVYFGIGYVAYYGKSNDFYVRCVRLGQ